MKSILKKFLLIFVIVVLSQPCIENTCCGMNTIDTETIKKLEKEDIWEIIKEIAEKKLQPTLECKIENLITNREVLEKCESFKTVTFANFVKNLDKDNLVDCLLENDVIVLGEAQKNEFTKFHDTETERKKLKEILANISKNIVGRLLLIRIGIAYLKNTKCKKQIKIKFGDACNINFKDNIVSINQNIADSVCYTTFSNRDGKDGPFLMHEKAGEAGIDVALFHELVHAFHRINSLENVGNGMSPKKLIYYKNGCTNSGISNVVKHPLFKYYFENFIGTRQKIDDHVNWKAQMMPWHVLTTEKVYRVNFEEMLTIAGLPVKVDDQATEGYESGDELSENLYRAEKGLPLRFGHRMFTYYESNEVYEKVKQCVETNLKELGFIFDYKKYTEGLPIGEPKLQIKYGEIKIEENSKIKTIEGLDKQDGFDGMCYYTINPSFNNLQVKEKFKYPLNVLVSANEELIDYYLRSEYNKWVFDRFRFD